MGDIDLDDEDDLERRMADVLTTSDRSLTITPEDETAILNLIRKPIATGKSSPTGRMSAD